jgi:putative aldouronate transport system substrate-binding protein
MKKAIALILSIILVMAVTFPASAISIKKVTKINLETSKITLKVGGTYSLKVIFTPTNTTQKLLSYSTSNQKIAKVDKTGKITAVSPGTIAITVTSLANKALSARFNVTVSEPLSPVKLTWYVLSNSQADDAKVYALANKYIKDKINATVDFYPLNMGEYNDKIKVKLAGQEPIDVVFTCSWLNNYNENVAKGALMAIDDLLVNYGAELKASIPQKYWDMVKIKKIGADKSRIFGVPNYQIEASVNGIAFRKDIAEKYNLVDAVNNAKNYDDLTPIFKVIKEKEPNMYPLLEANLTPEGKYDLTTKPYGYENVAMATSVNLKTFKALGIDNPEVASTEMKLAKIRRDWYLKGYLDKSVVANSVDLEPYKKQGKVFLYQLGACKPGVETEEKAKYGFDIIAKQSRAPVTSVGQVTATMNAIPNSTSNPERAMMLLNLVNTDKYLYNLLNFGVEKTHYKKLDANTIEVLKDSRFNPGMAWALGNQFNAFVQKGQPADVWEQTKKINANAISSPIEGFSFNTEYVKTEIAQMTAADDKYRAIILNGAADPEETIAKRNKEFNVNNNLKKIVAEVQKQLDAWRKANGK